MARFTWLMIVLACFTFVGCGGAEDTATTEKTEPTGATEVEDDLKEAGMTEEDYAKALKKQSGGK